ncbi:MAG: hypothetical protein WCY82_03685 [Desulfotomaculaceae bacterium]
MLYRAAVIVFIIAMVLLAGPAYGDHDLQQGGEQAVKAYNCHNLYYDNTKTPN